MEEILRNLIENALRASREADLPAVTVEATRIGHKVQITVTDNGNGFDMKDHDRLFGRFQSQHNASESLGTGAHLALVRTGVERLQGRVWPTVRRVKARQ